MDTKPLEGTENVVTTVVPAVPPSVDEMIADVVSVLPQMGACQPDLRVVMTLFTAYVSPEASGGRVDVSTALTELELTWGWDRDSIKAALEVVMRTVGEILVNLREQFAQETGTTLSADIVDFDIFAERYADERKEQAKLVDWAVRLLKSVQEVSGVLGIPNPDPSLQQQPEVPEVKVRTNWLRGIGGAVLSRGQQLLGSYVAMDTREQISETPSEPASWQTPPILDENDRELNILKSVVLPRLTADAQRTWDFLARLKLDRVSLTELLRSIATKARQQIKQSQEVLANAGKGYEYYARQVASLQNLQGVLISIRNFFFPEEAQAQG